MAQSDNVYYVWTEYALDVRPSDLAALLNNPRVRTAASKTRCNVEVTRRVLNRRQQSAQWARFSIVRITGPDDQSISQCNRLLERAIPAYQQRKEYPRRAPVTLYSKNVEAEGDLRSRIVDSALSMGKKRAASAVENSKDMKLEDGRPLSTLSDRNLETPVTGQNSFILDTSAHIQLSYDNPPDSGIFRTTTSQLKLEAHISGQSVITTRSTSDEQFEIPSPHIVSSVVSQINVSLKQAVSQSTVEAIQSMDVRNDTELADDAAKPIRVASNHNPLLAQGPNANNQLDVNVLQTDTKDESFPVVTIDRRNSKTPTVSVAKSRSLQELHDSNELDGHTSADPVSIGRSIERDVEQIESGTNLSLLVELSHKLSEHYVNDVNNTEMDLAVRAVLTTQASFESSTTVVHGEQDSANRRTDVINSTAETNLDADNQGVFSINSPAQPVTGKHSAISERSANHSLSEGQTISQSAVLENSAVQPTTEEQPTLQPVVEGQSTLQPVTTKQPTLKSLKMEQPASAAKLNEVRLKNEQINVQVMNEQALSSAHVTTNVKVEHESQPDSAFLADVHIAVEFKDGNVTTETPHNMPDFDIGAGSAILKTQLSVESVGPNLGTVVTDVNVALNRKEESRDPDSGTYRAGQMMELPAAQSGMKDITPTNSGSLVKQVMSDSSSTQRTFHHSKTPIENHAMIVASLNQRQPDSVQDHASDALVSLTQNSFQSEGKIATAKPSHSGSVPQLSSGYSSDAHVMLTESHQFVQDGKGYHLETQTAVQLTISQQSSEGLLELCGPSIRELQDHTKPNDPDHPERKHPEVLSAEFLQTPQPSLELSPGPPPPSLTSVIPAEYIEPPEPAFSPSPGAQPISPVSVATSISTNLEVHVNRETGQVDVSFEVNGTPIPAALSDASGHIRGPSFSAEWNVKLERNATFGPVGFIGSPIESHSSPGIVTMDLMQNNP